MLSLTGTLGTASTPYASSIAYAPQGAPTSLHLGNGLHEETCFNIRQQPTGIRVGAALTATLSTGACTNSGDLMNLAFTYGTATTNNGNVTSQVITRRSQDLTGPLTQSYAYAVPGSSPAVLDPANRLRYFGESSTLPPQTYAYDAFGNRAVTSGSLNGDNSLTPQTLGYNNYNRWPSFTYDLAGNEKSDGGNGAASYDAENRLSQITNSSGAVTTFMYDGEGRRVQKTVGSTTTTYVYDAAGKVAAEYSAVAPVGASTEYLTADHLGSTRLTTDSDGSPVQCHDYLPFGEEISPVLTSIRKGCYLGADGVTHKFSGKERDAETSNSAMGDGLDFFGARYFSAAQGRFTTPDWSATPQPVPYADLSDPQSLNLYAYVGNNPLSKVDPDGHADWIQKLRNALSGNGWLSDKQLQPRAPLPPQIDQQQGTQPSSHHEKKAQPTGLPQNGEASIYSDWFEGKTTASGETFSQKGYTAALLPQRRWHAVPLRTRVEITHDGKSVVVEVNDRGAGARDGSMTRVLDVTRAAASYLTGQTISNDNDSNSVGLISITITQVPNTTPLGPVSQEQK